MDTTSKKVVTRFAPSPTGFMHIGGVRTAIFAYLWARHNNGTFILRIEDTDKAREVAGSIEHIMESLTWLSIDWDYGPDKIAPFGSCIQSERLHIYRMWAEKLIEKGHAYPDPYTEEEVETFRKKAEEEKRPFLFRDHRPENFGVWDGTKPLRFKVPDIKRYHWNDAVRGDLEAGEEALDDFILIKSDGYPTYNFAHIIDDHEMSVTHVIRGEEFISSTPRFLSLYDALGFSYPVFVSAPQILRDDRTKKLGKRDGAKDILEYKAEGFLPETMFNFLTLVGWNPGTEQELFTKEELIKAFTLDRIQTAGAVFNEEKLEWMNREHMKMMPVGERNERIKKEFEIAAGKKVDDNILQKLYPVIFDRISKWSDIGALWHAGDLEYFISAPTLSQELLLNNGKLNSEETHVHLAWLSEKIEAAGESDFSSPETTKTLVFDYATEKGRGNVLWPLRVALSGREKSPDPFSLLSILGKDESLRRIKNAMMIV